MSDPFTMVYDALWSLVETPVMQGLVRVGNRVKYNELTDRDPLKQEIMAADLPELALVSEGLTASLINTSSSTMCRRSYSFVITTGDLRANLILFPVEWALFTALVRWREVLSQLVWQNENFIKRADITSVAEGELNSQLNRGIRGWTAIWRCEVEMHFRTSSLAGATSSSSSL